MKDFRDIIKSNIQDRDLCEPQIDFQAAIRTRNKMLQYIGTHDEVPMYLLAPEVKQLIDSVDDLKIAFLIKTLWITGARISAILKIKESDFNYVDDEEFGRTWYLSIVKLKVGRKPKDNEEIEDKLPRQIIKIMDNNYINSLRVYTATYNIKPHQKLFNITRATAYNWIKKAEYDAQRKGIVFPIKIDTYTFRHSHAVQLLYHGFSRKKIQMRLGHKKAENTEIYTRIFELDNNEKIRFF